MLLPRSYISLRSELEGTRVSMLQILGNIHKLYDITPISWFTLYVYVVSMFVWSGGFVFFPKSFSCFGRLLMLSYFCLFVCVNFYYYYYFIKNIYYVWGLKEKSFFVLLFFFFFFFWGGGGGVNGCCFLLVFKM